MQAKTKIMKAKITITLLTLLFSIFAKGQVKIWNSERDNIKTKGTLLTIEREVEIQSDPQIKILFPASTVVGTLLPFAFKYGNSALKELTSKDEKEYSSENLSINKMNIEFNELDNDSIKFNTSLKYYKKGEDEISLASMYWFSIKKGENSVIISLDDTSLENYIPVKTKKKYDYVLETFEFQVSAVAKTRLNDSISVVELKDLGSTKITRTVSSFSKGISEIWDNGIVFVPKFNSSGKEIEIKELIISPKITYLNPYGLSQSTLNKFLENNSDTNESLLNTIFIKAEDD
jgi:hypothetical protein